MVCGLNFAEGLRRLTSLAGMAAAIVLAGCGPSEADFVPYKTYSSPDGTIKLDIDAAPPKLAFGPETVRLFVTRPGTSREHVATRKLANDGGGVHDDNVYVTWSGSQAVTVCLSGDEMKDLQILINLETPAIRERERDCRE